jgi:hypothetical protein
MSTGRNDAVDGRVDGILIEVEYADGVVVVGEPTGGRPTDPRPGAGHEGGERSSVAVAGWRWGNAHRIGPSALAAASPGACGSP